MAKQKSEQFDERVVLDFVDENQDTLEGFEDVTQQTMAVPFVRIAQQLTPQVKKNNSAYIEGLEPGMFFNTVTKEVYGQEMHVVVLKFERIYIEWLPDRGGFVSYHTPENAERIAADKTFGKWKTADGNTLQENYVYFVLIAGHESEGVAILSCSSTMIKTAREWNRLMTTHVMDNGQRAMPYYLVWKLNTESWSNDQYDWYGFGVEFAGYINEEQYALIKPERKALPDRQVNYAQLGDDRVRADSDDEDIDENVQY